MASLPSPTITFRWRTAASSTYLFPPHVDLRTGQQQQFLHSGTNLSTSQPHNLSPLARLQIPTISSDTTVLFHLVWAISVEPRRVCDLVAERNSGLLWGCRESCSWVLILVRLLVQKLGIRIWSWIPIWLLEMAITEVEVRLIWVILL